MHETGGKRAQGDQLLAVQRLDLIGLQALCAVIEDDFPYRGAAGKQRPEILFAKAKQNRVLRDEDAEHRRRSSRKQRRFPEGFATVHDAHQGPVSIRLGALDADFALEEEPVELPWRAGFHQNRAGLGDDAVNKINATDAVDLVEGCLGEDAGARESLRDVAQMDRFDLDGLWTFAHLASRCKLASGAKAPLLIAVFRHD